MGTEIDPETLQVVDEMDTLRMPYRFFSLDNSALAWSSLDETGILLQLAGGSPFALDLPLPDAGGPAFVFLGIDLGHPKTGPLSWLVVTAVDAQGQLLAYWKGQQLRDETPDAAKLQEAMKWIHNQLRQQYGGDYRPVVMRDGRMLANESLRTFGPCWGEAFTAVEVIKRPVPLMLEGDACALAGTMCVPDGSDYFFLLTSRSRVSGHVAQPLKVRVSFDGLALGRDRIARLLTGLCYAPALGLSPTRSPAPIYWADGIAAIGPTNHQFAGLHFVPHN
jgi:hypothetical protein